MARIIKKHLNRPEPKRYEGIIQRLDLGKQKGLIASPGLTMKSPLRPIRYTPLVFLKRDIADWRLSWNITSVYARVTFEKKFKGGEMRAVNVRMADD